MSSRDRLTRACALYLNWRSLQHPVAMRDLYELEAADALTLFRLKAELDDWEPTPAALPPPPAQE